MFSRVLWKNAHKKKNYYYKHHCYTITFLRFTQNLKNNSEKHVFFWELKRSKTKNPNVYICMAR